MDRSERRVRSENPGLQGILEVLEIRETREPRVGTELPETREREARTG